MPVPLLRIPLTSNGEFLRFRRPTPKAPGSSIMHRLPPPEVPPVKSIGWAQGPAPALAGLRVWLTAENSGGYTPPGTCSTALNINLAVRNGILTDLANRSGCFNNLANASSNFLYDGTDPGDPVMWFVSGGGTSYTPPNTFTHDRRASAFFLIGEQVVNRPGQGDDVFLQCGNGSNGKAGIDSVTRRLMYGSGVGGVVSTGRLVYSRRCLMGWSMDNCRFTFYLNDRTEDAAALTIGETAITQFPAMGTQGWCWKDLLIFDRYVTPDDVYNKHGLLNYAREARGVRTEYNSTLICDGDSLTMGFKSSFGRNYPRCMGLRDTVRYVNLGLNGITAATLNSDFALKPQIFVPGSGEPARCLIVLWGGSNDIKNGTSAATTYTSLTSYISSAHALSPSVPVAILTMLPRTDVSGAAETERGTLNTSINGNAAGADYVIDVAADSRLSNASDATYFFSDGIHLTDLGYRVVGSLVAPTVKAALQ